MRWRLGHLSCSSPVTDNLPRIDTEIAEDIYVIKGKSFPFCENPPTAMRHLLPLILLAPLLLAVPTVYAAPAEATGSFAGAAPEVTSTRTAGHTAIITQNVSFDFSGTFTGPCVGTETDIILSEDTFTFQGMCTFNGTVDGKSGKAVFIDRGVGTRNGFHGRFAVVSSSGGLEGLHAWGAFQVTGPGSGTYSGQFLFTS